ncbi:hypothetical protein ACFFJ7_13050 [Pseudochelatococcus lubricantis]|uniref:hypothetical protein n=1 Tax=Pseudochelatococcus lubricantis TaxID=1538102 RepID=UPI0035E6A3CB
MASFQISDPPPNAVLAEAAEVKGTYNGLVAFTVENLTGQNLTASLSVLPAEEAERALYRFEGASVTNPTLYTVDFGPREVHTVKLAIAAPAGAAPKASSFRLRVALENGSDTDSVESRPVAFTVPALPAAPPPAKKPFPWWAVAVAAVLVIGVAGGLTYAFWPKPEVEEEEPGDQTTAAPAITGTWINVNANTRSIPQIVIANDTVHVWGKCSPTNCDWGTTPLRQTRWRRPGGTTYVARPLPNRYSAFYDQGFATRTMSFRLDTTNDQLNVTTATAFKDNSGRPDRSETEQFRRQ